MTNEQTVPTEPRSEPRDSYSYSYSAHNLRQSAYPDDNSAISQTEAPWLPA